MSSATFRSFLLPITALACMSINGITVAYDMEVIFSEAPGHATAVVPGAKDINGDPVFTEFKAMELLSVSPDGMQWLLKSRNWLGSDLEAMLMLGSGTAGSVLAQEGQPVHDGEPNELYDFIGSSPPHFNDLGQYVYTARARGGNFDTKHKGIFYDGTDFHIVRQESDPALGLLDLPPNQSGDELFGNSFGSMHVLNNGTIGYQDSTIKNLHSTRRPAIFYNDTAFAQSDVTPVGESTWDSLDSNDFWTTPDGSTWIAQGDDYSPETSDDILYVETVTDGATGVVLREGTLISDTDITVAAIFHTKLLGNGDWYSRGDDPADNDWAVRNGELLAASGDPITTGAGENWADVFYAFTGNTLGDWVLVGNTENMDPDVDSVIVLNGEEVIVREGDPVDLDGNGMFDDDAFIGRGVSTSAAFRPDDLFLSDGGYLYFLASLRNAAGEDLGSFGTGGDAFIRVLLVDCPADLTGDNQVNIDDIFAVLGLWDDCPDPCPPYCLGDLTEDCTVNIDDIFAILGMWGLCD